MIGDLENRDTLQRLTKHQEWLEFLTSIDTDSKHILSLLLSDDKLIHNMIQHDVLPFMSSIDPHLRSDMIQTLAWDRSKLRKLTGNKNTARVLFNAWGSVRDLDQFLDCYARVAVHPYYSQVNCDDAFSLGQVMSKTWLCDTVSSMDLRLGLTWILGGWIGSLSYFLLERHTEMGIDRLRSFDIQDLSTGLAEQMNHKWLNEWFFKATTLDINDLLYENFTYTTMRRDGSLQDICESPDTIINTSCDHMQDRRDWFENIPVGRLVILQNNDWHDNAQHSSTVRNLNEMKAAYPLQNLLFAGELDCKMYTRFMLIGYK